MNDEANSAEAVLVVIPVRDRAVMLRRAVESVLAQTFQGFELVVVDDASQEDLSEVKSLVEGAGHRWLRLGKNVGPAAARNMGAVAAAGDAVWLSFLDSDDVWAVDKLERQLLWHSENPRFRISQCEETWVRNGQPFKKKKSQQQPEGWVFEDCVKACCISPSCVMLSMDLWQDLGGFDERYRVCEDYELWLRASLQHQVGLVRGGSGALVTRHGGHGDQLSFAVAAMDRFRVMALLDLRANRSVSFKLVNIIEGRVLRWAQILCQGAEKRGKVSDVKTYQRAVKGEWKEMAEELEKICCF